MEADVSARRAEAARILRGVAELFADPSKWTQGAWARDARGARLVRALDDTAICWCLLGAIKRVRGPGITKAEDIAQDALRRVLQLHGETIAGWNDHHRRAVDEVRTVCIVAAETLEARL